MSAVPNPSDVLTLPFVKMHGLGNDFVMLESRHVPADVSLEKLAAYLCNRHFGIGGDGLIMDAAPTQSTDPMSGEPFDTRFVYLNGDGSWAEMCGNGIRCFARFVRDLNLVSVEKEAFLVETLAGPIRPKINADQTVTVDMGAPIFEAAKIPFQGGQSLEAGGQSIPVTAISMGNPHCLLFQDDLPKALDPAVFGPLLEVHPAFPKKTNVEFLEVLDGHTLRCTVWERGCGFTLACGTGACASAVGAILAGKVKSPVTVQLPGGSLLIEWESGQHVMMSGPATYAFSGTVDLQKSDFVK